MRYKKKPLSRLLFKLFISYRAVLLLNRTFCRRTVLLLDGALYRRAVLWAVLRRRATAILRRRVAGVIARATIAAAIRTTGSQGK